MNFRDFGKYNQFKEQFAGMSPEMKEQMMRMAKEQMKARISAFVQKWLSLPILTVVAAVIGAIVGALTAFFGQVLLAVSAVRDANPLYWIPGLALIGVVIVLGYKKFGKGTERGMDMVFGVAHGKESEIPLRMIPMVAVSTWLTHLFGGSAGREGVAIQIGATLGHNISKKIHIENASKILLIAGMAAGFAGLFQTPLAAIALALEVLLVGYLNLSALLPATVHAFPGLECRRTPVECKRIEYSICTETCVARCSFRHCRWRFCQVAFARQESRRKQVAECVQAHCLCRHRY